MHSIQGSPYTKPDSLGIPYHTLIYCNKYEVFFLARFGLLDSPWELTLEMVMSPSPRHMCIPKFTVQFKTLAWQSKGFIFFFFYKICQVHNGTIRAPCKGSRELYLCAATLMNQIKMTLNSRFYINCYKISGIPQICFFIIIKIRVLFFLMKTVDFGLFYFPVRMPDPSLMHLTATTRERAALLFLVTCSSLWGLFARDKSTLHYQCT